MKKLDLEVITKSDPSMTVDEWARAFESVGDAELALSLADSEPIYDHLARGLGCPENDRLHGAAFAALTVTPAMPSKMAGLYGLSLCLRAIVLSLKRPDALVDTLCQFLAGPMTAKQEAAARQVRLRLADREDSAEHARLKQWLERADPRDLPKA